MELYVSKLLRRANLPRRIADHLIGQQHSRCHQCLIGLGLMIVGVLVARGAAEIHFVVIHVAGDLIGYGIHGLGLTPYVEAIVKIAEEE